jgi:hypothetical protein
MVVHDLVACRDARQRRGAMLPGSHHRYRLLLERDHLARGEGAAWDVGPLTDLATNSPASTRRSTSVLTAAKERAPMPRVSASRRSANRIMQLGLKLEF